MTPIISNINLFSLLVSIFFFNGNTGGVYIADLYVVADKKMQFNFRLIHTCPSQGLNAVAVSAVVPVVAFSSAPHGIKGEGKRKKNSRMQKYLEVDISLSLSISLSIYLSN